MAGSTGVAKYEKYFDGKTVKTTIKATKYYDPINPKKMLGYLQQGTEVTVLPKKSYHQFDSKYLITVKNSKKRFLVPGDNVSKPINKLNIAFKPQFMGIEENPEGYTAKEIVKVVKKTIKTRKDIPTLVKKYMLYLVNHCARMSHKVPYDNKFTTISDFYMGQIRRDFGEILGGLYVLTDKKLKLKKPRIYFPSAGNNPVVDFMIMHKNGKIEFSSKTKTEGNATGTLPVKYVAQVIRDSKRLLKKWNKRKEYRLIKTLHENSSYAGPLMAAQEFFGGSYKKEIKAIFSGKRHKKLIEIIMEASLTITRASRAMNFNELFKDVTKGKVTYIVLERLNGEMLPEWKTSNGEINPKHPVYLRSRNTKSLIEGKMGLQM